MKTKCSSSSVGVADVQNRQLDGQLLPIEKRKERAAKKVTFFIHFYPAPGPARSSIDLVLETWT